MLLPLQGLRAQRVLQVQARPMCVERALDIKPDMTDEEYQQLLKHLSGYYKQRYPKQTKMEKADKWVYDWIRDNVLCGRNFGMKDIRTKWYKIVSAVNEMLAEELMNSGMITFPDNMGTITMYTITGKRVMSQNRLGTKRLWLEDSECRKDKVHLYADKDHDVCWPIFEKGSKLSSARLFFKPFKSFKKKYMERLEQGALFTYEANEEQRKLFYKKFLF